MQVHPENNSAFISNSYAMDEVQESNIAASEKSSTPCFTDKGEICDGGLP